MVKLALFAWQACLRVEECDLLGRKRTCTRYEIHAGALNACLSSFAPKSENSVGSQCLSFRCSSDSYIILETENQIMHDLDIDRGKCAGTKANGLMATKSILDFCIAISS